MTDQASTDRHAAAPTDDPGAHTQPQAGTNRLLSNSMLAILDQAWLSALNLALGLILIRLTTKDDYGIYAQLFVGGLFATTVVDALITHPLTTLSASKPAAERATMIAYLDRFHQRLTLALALMGAIACAVAAHMAGSAMPVLLGASFSAYLYANARREYRRSIAFIEGQASLVLRTDTIYGIALIIGVAVLTLGGWLALPLVFGVMAAANLPSLVSRRDRPALVFDQQAYRASIAATWSRGKHALPGALSSWVINYSYLYLTALWIGVAASAELNASRLLLMPISLCIVAWARVACPAFAHMLGLQQRTRILRMLALSAIGLQGLAICYIGVLWLLLPWLEHHILGTDYVGMEPLVAAWGVYFLLYAAHWVGTALLMAADRYRAMLKATLASLVLLLLLLPACLHAFGTVGAIIALAGAEVLAVVLHVAIAWPLLRSRHTTLQRID